MENALRKRCVRQGTHTAELCLDSKRFDAEFNCNIYSLFLNNVQNLSNCIKIRDTGHEYEDLLSTINLQLLKASICVSEFEELCEAFTSLLYFGLVYPKPGRHKNVSALITSFLDKWFVAYESYDFNQLIISIDPQYRILSFASVLLLFNYYELNLTSESAQHLLNWKPPSISSQQWLKETLSCKDDIHKNLSKILNKSLYYTECNDSIDFDNCYLKTFSLFLSACSSYASKNYKGSLELCSVIDFHYCGNLIRGWVSTLKGLNFEYLDKPQSALIEYKESLCHSVDCFYSLYYSSRIFKKSSQSDAELQVLELMTKVNPENLTTDSSLHTTLMHYHLPVPSKLHLKALWLLASSYHRYQRWPDARKTYFSILTEWDSDTAAPSRKEPLLMPHDRIPDLPPKTCIRMGYIASLLFLRNYEEVDAQVNELDDLRGQLHDDFEELSTQGKLGYLSTTISHLLVVESIYHQCLYKEALALCSRFTSSVDMLHSAAEGWKTLILQTKNYFYKLLTLLYDSREVNLRENSLHFKRLQHNVDRMLTKDSEETLNEDVTSRLAFENAKLVLKARVEEINKL